MNTFFYRSLAISHAECVALPGQHGSKNLHLLLTQMFETGLHQTHLLTPHLQKKGLTLKRLYLLISHVHKMMFKNQT